MERKPDLISAETAAVMGLMYLGGVATHIATYSAHCQHYGGAISADVYRENALEELAKLRDAIDLIEGVLVAAAPKPVAA